MNRRSFLSTLIASGALYTAGAVPGLGASARAAEFPITDQAFLVSILLAGGPNFRHLFPPEFVTDPQSFAFNYWKSNASAHGIGEETSVIQQRWQDDYFHIGTATQNFGLLKSCGWLKNMWDDGHVAIVNNVLSTSSRSHPLGILAAEQGNRNANPNNSDVPGWGGLLADAAQTNVMSLTQTPRSFCYGASTDGITGRSDSRLISATDTREITLFSPPPDLPADTPKAIITRGVSSYYSAKRSNFLTDPLAARIASHELKLREFGQPIDERLASLPVPASIDRLYNPTGTTLGNVQFGAQIRNLYDSLACADILNMGLAALEFRGWDSHRLQKQTIEPHFYDLFGEQQALDSLFSELPAHITDKLVLVLGGEFGRQIRSNGDGGTDHGEGTSMLIIGKPVNGGVYGDMYPQSELELLNDPSPQIKGLTGIDAVYARISDWYQAGSSALMFPELGNAPIENGLNLSELFK